jgi:hypothetical protein
MTAKRRTPGAFAKRWATLVVVGVVLCLAAAIIIQGDDRVVLLPRLQAGQTLRYQIYGSVQRHVTTESRITSILKPPELKEDISVVLQVTIKEVREEHGRPVAVALAEFELPKDSGGANTSAAMPKVDFTIAGDGHLEKVAGLNDLGPELRVAWQFWIARFAYGWTLPAEGTKPGEKWKSHELEWTPGPIAKLVWERETLYGKNDRCAILPAESCAAFLTTASLTQKSSSRDATPEDFRLHDLKTSGTARGTNEIFTSISLRTGLVMRATEELKQSMDVVITKTDETNAIHYTVDATSHFEMLFVPARIASFH